MSRLALGLTWSRNPDIVFNENNEEVARIKFQSGKNGRKVIIEAKASIKISRDYSNPKKS